MRFIISILPICMLLLPCQSRGQGLFESGGASVSQSSAQVEFKGYVRATGFVGPYLPATRSEMQSGYGETALRLDARAENWGSMNTEIRFRQGFIYGEAVNQLDIREAYVDFWFGGLEIRAGQQILAWGRADALNPTNNLTPKDYFVRSPASDDMRMGNVLLRSRYLITNRMRLEAVWVPVYRYSSYRFDLFEIPEYVHFSTSEMPVRTLDNGALAIKLELLHPRVDGSLSWFNGYDPMPGIQPGEIHAGPPFSLPLYVRAFRQQTLGFDAAFGMGLFGVRGEAALRIPVNPSPEAIHIPRKDLRYVLELDRVIGAVSISLMYAGHHVFDYTPLPVTGEIPELEPSWFEDPDALAAVGPMLEQELEGFNRLIFNQSKAWSHTIMVRPALSLFHQALKMEIFGGYQISTDEWNLLPRLTWQAGDHLKIILGGQFYEGPDNSLYALIRPVLNCGFLEMRYNF